MSIKFLVLGGGILGLGGGGGFDFIFMGARIFLTKPFLETRFVTRPLRRAPNEILRMVQERNRTLELQEPPPDLLFGNYLVSIEHFPCFFFCKEFLVFCFACFPQFAVCTTKITDKTFIVPTTIRTARIAILILLECCDVMHMKSL